MNWPFQSGCDEFYGNPRHGLSWRRANLVAIVSPWQMHDDDTKEPIASFLMHRKVQNSINGILQAIWQKYGKNQQAIQNAKIDLFAGSYVFRDVRGASHLSMHAYGVAIDIAGNENQLGVPWRENHGMMPMDVVKIFKAQGWIWGGNWSRPDCMHFQAARIG